MAPNALTTVTLVFLAACGGGAEGGDKAAPPPAPAPAAVQDSAAADTTKPTGVPDTAKTRVATRAAAAQRADSAATVDTAARSLLREVFAYTGGNRDPFLSLLSVEGTGPELPDLTLIAVYLDTGNPANSVAVLRERVRSRRYNVHPGDRLGRLLVASIAEKTITFLIDDFGTERRESLSLRKPEDANP